MRWLANGGSIRGVRLYRAVILLAALGMSACAATHTQHVSLDKQQYRQLRVIGLPQFTAAKKIDIRRENPLFAVIGLSAKAVQQLMREYKRNQYQNANPELLKKSLVSIRKGIKLRLQRQGYIVRDLPMDYWQAQAAYRKKSPGFEDIDALLDVEIKRFGYFSGSPFKPYRPGIIMASDLIATKDRKKLSSNVYNIGFDPEDLSKFDLRVDYFTTIHVADPVYFYRNFDSLMANARQSTQGLEFVARVAAESIAGDLNRQAQFLNLASSKARPSLKR